MVHAVICLAQVVLMYLGIVELRKSRLAGLAMSVAAHG
jgi:hypothetical protein